MKKRGRILKDTNSGPGLLSAEGVQYSFTLEGMWRSDYPPRPGMIVDVVFDAEGAPQAIWLVSNQRRGSRDGASARPLNLRGGVMLFAVEMLMLLAFFLLPSLSVGALNQPLTGWEIVGVDTNSLATTGHGWFRVCAILCLFAPLSVPFFRWNGSQWLCAAPLCFALIALATVMAQRHFAGGENADVGLGSGVARAFSHHAPAVVHVNAGLFLIFVCAGYLAAQSFPPHSSSP
jgi:hypothetical protein